PDPYLRVDTNDYSLDPHPGRAPRGGARLTGRGDRGSAGYRRAGLPPRAHLRPPPHRRRARARPRAQRAALRPTRARGRDPITGQIRRPDPGMTSKTSELAHLFRALKAPAAARALPKLADRAREEEWSYERFVQTLLETEVSARDSHGGEARIRQARFPARKTLERSEERRVGKEGRWGGG